VRLLGMAIEFGGIVAYTTLKQNSASVWEKSDSKSKSKKEQRIVDKACSR
jgi:hypothetical protein